MDSAKMLTAPTYYSGTKRAVAYMFLDACTRQDIEAARIFMADATVPVATLNFDVYPVFVAAARRNTELLRLLLEAGFNPNLRDATVHNGTLLHFCAINSDEAANWQNPLTSFLETPDSAPSNQEKIVSDSGLPENKEVSDRVLPMFYLLLYFDADLNVQDDFGRTPLVLAVQNHAYALATEMIRAGANAEVQDEHCKTASFYAYESGAPDELQKQLPPFKYDCLAAHFAYAEACSKTSTTLMWNAAAATKAQKDYSKKKAKKPAAPAKK